VAVNREVVIRPGRVGTQGERTDILVEASVAVRAGGPVLEPLQVIIEVKGNWNPELKTAVQDQLCRYLKKNSCRHGLYLVGWFAREHWHKGDRRREKAPDWKLTDARAFFKKQADEMSDAYTHLRAFVLDAQLSHQPRPRNAQRHRAISPKRRSARVIGQFAMDKYISSRDATPAGAPFRRV
jgi:hypothetical protein